MLSRKDIAGMQTPILLLSSPSFHVWGTFRCLVPTLLHCIPESHIPRLGASRTEIQILSSKGDRLAFLTRASFSFSLEFYLWNTWCRGKCTRAKSIIQLPVSLLSIIQLPLLLLFFPLNSSLPLFWTHSCFIGRWVGGSRGRKSNEGWMHKPCNFLELWFLK